MYTCIIIEINFKFKTDPILTNIKNIYIHIINQLSFYFIFFSNQTGKVTGSKIILQKG